MNEDRAQMDQMNSMCGRGEVLGHSPGVQIGPNSRDLSIWIQVNDTRFRLFSGTKGDPAGRWRDRKERERHRDK